jgi:hypothetical protein
MSLFDGIVLAVAAVLIAASIPIVVIFDRGRTIDHLARTLVAIGVALTAAFVAVTIFDMNAQKLENERRLVQQQAKQGKTFALISTLRYFAIEYGFAAYQVHVARLDCEADGGDPARRNLCRESADYAINVGRVLPQDFALITALSEVSPAFARSVRVTTLLTDAEMTIKVRMPVAVQTYLTVSLSGDQAPPVATRDRFIRSLTDFENVAEDAAIGLCTFAAALTRGEAELEAAVTSIETAVVDTQVPMHDVLRTNAKGVNMGEFDCSNPRAQIERNLTAANGAR